MTETNQHLTRVEKHVISPSDEWYRRLAELCALSKNLYNHANYLARQAFFKEGKWLRYTELDQLLKKDLDYPDYRAMPTAQSAQQTLRLLEENWASFFASIKDWTGNREKYTGRPRPPKYLDKKGRYILVFTNQNCRIRDGLVRFPKVLNGFSVKPEFLQRDDYSSFQQVRLVPRGDRIIIELVYKIPAKPQLPENGRLMGIDIGVNNLVVACNNAGAPAFAINGRPLKSINQNYNRMASHYQEVSMRMNGQYSSRRLRRLSGKRNTRIDDYMHKASRYIVNYCVENQIHTIVIGANKEWKQGSSLSRKENQHFVQIPFARLVQMIQYKAQEAGVAVILTEESYTSGTSFIDHEDPVKENYDKSRRKYRGLFRSNNGVWINADLNGAYQILKKVFPIKWDSGCALHPVVVSIA